MNKEYSIVSASSRRISFCAIAEQLKENWRQYKIKVAIRRFTADVSQSLWKAE
jgi:hypothetical protein